LWQARVPTGNPTGLGHLLGFCVGRGALGQAEGEPSKTASILGRRWTPHGAIPARERATARARRYREGQSLIAGAGCSTLLRRTPIVGRRWTPHGVAGRRGAVGCGELGALQTTAIVGRRWTPHGAAGRVRRRDVGSLGC